MLHVALQGPGVETPGGEGPGRSAQVLWAEAEGESGGIRGERQRGGTLGFLVEPEEHPFCTGGLTASPTSICGNSFSLYGPSC